MENYRYEIYIGIVDKDNKNKLHSLDNLNKQISILASEGEIPFSLCVQKGGYLHDNGKFVVEDSIKITSIRNIDSEKLKVFCDAVKNFFNQESILVSRKLVEQEYK